jgi:hypothetical protein
MKQIELPVVDLGPYDSLEVYLSNRTGAWLLYRYRRVRGRSDTEALLVATYGSRAEAMRIRNRLRMAVERLRTSYEYDERLKVWSALDVAQGARA